MAAWHASFKLTGIWKLPASFIEYTSRIATVFLARWSHGPLHALSGEDFGPKCMSASSRPGIA
jgi:hypothetical protein